MPYTKKYFDTVIINHACYIFEVICVGPAEAAGLACLGRKWALPRATARASVRALRYYVTSVLCFDCYTSEFNEIKFINLPRKFNRCGNLWVYLVMILFIDLFY